MQRRMRCEPLENRRVFAAAIDQIVDAIEQPVVVDDIAAMYSSKVPALSSNVEASQTLFLDFDGFTYDGMINIFNDPSVPAFSMDDLYESLNAEELQTIEDTWKFVAEDFSPFDVNVTTVDPGKRAFENGKALRVAIGGTSDWFGDEISGVSIGAPYVNAAYPNVVWTFSEVIQQRAGDPGRTDGDGRRIEFLDYLANTISHEAGHGYGLAHHSDYDASGVRLATYTGGENLRTPLMGSNRARDRATWDQTDIWRLRTDDSGEPIKNAEGQKLYEFSHPQNDMDVLANALGYRVDDHGGNALDATAMVSSGLSSLGASGVIEQVDDEDWFAFWTSGGNVSFSIDTVEEIVNLNDDGIDNDEDGTLDEGDEFGWGAANLDVRADLYAMDWATGELDLVESADPENRLGAQVGSWVKAGNYVLVVTSHGHVGDAGQYTVRGTAPSRLIDIPTVPIFWPNDSFALPTIDPRVDDMLDTQKDVLPTKNTTEPSVTEITSADALASQKAVTKAIDTEIREIEPVTKDSALDLQSVDRVFEKLGAKLAQR